MSDVKYKVAQLSVCKCDVAGRVVVSYRIEGALCHHLVVRVTS